MDLSLVDREWILLAGFVLSVVWMVSAVSARNKDNAVGVLGVGVAVMTFLYLFAAIFGR